MSEDKRKTARTQGRFSNEKEFHPTRRDKDKQNQKKSQEENKTSNRDEKQNKASKVTAATGAVSLQYQDNATHVFKELAEKKKAEEIRETGVRILSKTENGESRIIYETDFLHRNEAEEFKVIINDSTKWYDKNIIIHGNSVPQPRLVAWYGPFEYSYSGAVLDAAEMPDYILAIKARIEDTFKKYNIDAELNSVLLNLYRNEKDSVAWHSDDEHSMGICPTIASVSLGAIRAFEMKPKFHVKDIDPETVLKINLEPGSLLIMDGCMQKDWLHRVPKEYHSREPRINLTFRTVYSLEKSPINVPYLEEKVVTQECNFNCTQLEHVYDSESFPPLTPVSNQNNKSLNKTDTEHCMNVQETPDSHENTCSSLNVSEDEKLLDAKNKNFKKNVSSDGVNNFSRNCDEAMNLLEESSVSKLSLSNSLVNNESISDTISHIRDTPGRDLKNENVSCENKIQQQTEGYPDHNSQECSRNEQHKETSNGTGNRHQLNANAPDFIPQSIRDQVQPRNRRLQNRSLRDLAELYLSNDIEPGEMEEFSYILINSVKSIKQTSNREIFTQRDWFELDTLCSLSDGGQNENNQKLINHRICSLTKYALKHEGTRPPRRTSYCTTRHFYRHNSHRY